MHREASRPSPRKRDAAQTIGRILLPQWPPLIAPAGTIGTARKEFLPLALRRCGASDDVPRATVASRVSHLSNATALPPTARCALQLLVSPRRSLAQYID